MAFGIGTNADKRDSGRLKGIKFDAAVDCWFTSTGKTMPRLIKILDQGVVKTITMFKITSSDRKFYCGIPSIEYTLIIYFENSEMDAKLIYELEESKWRLVL